MTSLKGPGAAQKHDGSELRIGIVHARWNSTIIEPLLAGTKKTLLSSGVKEENIIIQSVPGSWELPIACSKLFSASQIQSSTTISGDLPSLSAGDLLGSSTTDLPSLSLSKPQITSTSKSTSSSPPALKTPFDALIAIGVLIKGETMHFEYIAESVSHGLMRIQLDTGVPLIFGLLTVLDEEQALMRAGCGSGEGKEGKGHNHGEDWGAAAVELGVRRREWAAGKIV